MGSLKNLTTTDAYATRVTFRLQIGVFSVSAELNRYLQSACDQGQDKRKKGDGEPLEIVRWRSEGFHGEAKTWHGLARAVRRGLANMKIQAYLTAAAIQRGRRTKAKSSNLNVPSVS